MKIRKINFKKIPRLSIWPATLIISFQLCAGMILGYLIAKVFSGNKTGECGRIGSMIINIRSYKIHLHHWLVGIAGLTGLYFSDLSSYFAYGVFGGMVYQGVFTYNDWYKILMKRRVKIIR